MKKNKNQKPKVSKEFSGINVRLPHECLLRIEQLSEQENMRRGAYIRKIVLDYCDKKEAACATKKNKK